MSSKEKAPRHTEHTGLTPKDAYNVITDPEVLPSLDEASVPRKIQSTFVLLFLLCCGLFGAWFLGVDILQSQTQIVGIGVAVALAIAFAGGFNVDWWDLVVGYWWLSMPVAGLAGIAFLLVQETTSGIQETD
ncbi:hypothetical protein MMC26_002243 [Xylographa opegraphella]|nr:hypothetical protein [Xylographa opegraphella]